ncbi:hypothetical protein AQJ27_10065, partial [Streptomyces olivochromogenes]
MRGAAGQFQGADTGVSGAGGKAPRVGSTARAGELAFRQDRPADELLIRRSELTGELLIRRGRLT